MDFTKYEMAMMIGGVLQKVNITPDALQFWWGADTGPQTAEDLVAAHIDEIEKIVVQKLERDEIDNAGIIIVSDEDLE